MKDQPPYMTDDEADRTWQQGNERLFGRKSPSIQDLQNQINDLQDQLDRRKLQSSSDTMAQDTPFTARIFRQGQKSNTSDKNPKHPLSQSKTHKKGFVQPKERSNFDSKSTFFEKYCG